MADMTKKKDGGAAFPKLRQRKRGMTNLFSTGTFRLASGMTADWKIDCDALTDADWRTLAGIASKRFRAFGDVEGVPRGGLPFARALEPFVTRGPTLIVDDVLTTGGSLERQRAGREDVIGCVVFTRGPWPEWVTPLFVDHDALRAATPGESK